MNRSELVGQTLRAALNVIATVDPKWLAASVDGSWYLKYAKRFETNRSPLTKEGMVAATEGIGMDGMKLLDKIWRTLHHRISALCRRSKFFAGAGSSNSGSIAGLCG